MSVSIYCEERGDVKNSRQPSWLLRESVGFTKNDENKVYPPTKQMKQGQTPL